MLFGADGTSKRETTTRRAWDGIKGTKRRSEGGEGERTVRPAQEETEAARSEREKEMVGWSESQMQR